MIVKSWEKLPIALQTDEVRPYYEILRHMAVALAMKRLFDVVMSIILIIILLPVFIVIGLLIKFDSRGPVLFRQERVTQYGKVFKIMKFRTMVIDAESNGSLVTVNNDSRITMAGKKLRKYRFDELPQLVNILAGSMTFIGTRPEVPKYVAHYTNEMKATLLLPAGVTSRASIEFKDEEKLLQHAEDIDDVYIHEILPRKMKMNLRYLKTSSPVSDLKLIIKTVVQVIL